MSAAEPWINDLLHHLEIRDNLEYKDAIIQESVVKLHEECSRLSHTNKILQRENQDLTIKAENPAKSHDLEVKLFRLQEEVTELHRSKGKLANDFICLNKELQSKAQQMQKQTTRITKLEGLINDLKKLNQSLNAELSAITNANQVLLDEQAATMLTVKSMESQNHKLEDDNRKLIRQIEILQLKLEEFRNIESDMKFRLQREAIQKSLLDAVTTRSSSDCQSADSPALFTLTVLPNKSLAKVDTADDVNCVRFSPSGTSFCSGGLDRTVHIWKVHNGRCEIKSSLVGCNAGLSAVDFNPLETMVLGASSDFACRVWTLLDCRLKINLTGHSERVIAARFIGESNRVVTTSADRTIKLWDLEKRQCTRTLMSVSACQDVLACCSLQCIISGHFDKKLRIWDQRSGATTNEVSLSGRITGLDLSIDGSHVLACTRNDSLHTIELRQSEVVRSFQADGFSVNSDFVRPCFSPDGQFVACGSQDGGVYIWNAFSGNVETVLREHENMVICTNWNPTGNSLVSCERGRKIVVWSKF